MTISNTCVIDRKIKAMFKLCFRPALYIKLKETGSQITHRTPPGSLARVNPGALNPRVGAHALRRQVGGDGGDRNRWRTKGWSTAGSRSGARRGGNVRVLGHTCGVLGCRRQENQILNEKKDDCGNIIC